MACERVCNRAIKVFLLLIPKPAFQEAPLGQSRGLSTLGHAPRAPRQRAGGAGKGPSWADGSLAIAPMVEDLQIDHLKTLPPHVPPGVFAPPGTCTQLNTAALTGPSLLRKTRSGPIQGGLGPGASYSLREVLTPSTTYTPAGDRWNPSL